MNRKEFMNACAFACFGGVAFTTFLNSCSLTKTVSGKIVDADILVDIKEFEILKKGLSTFRKYIILQNELLNFPICIYRFNDTDYTAIYLQCSHQGAELQVFGEKLHCPAHGSEFSNRGMLENGPATSDLRTFPIQLINSQLSISLK